MRAALLLLVACSSANVPRAITPPVDDPGVAISSEQLALATHARWTGDAARAAKLLANARDVDALAELGRAELALGHVAAADAAFARAVKTAERGKRGAWAWPVATTQRIMFTEVTRDGRWIVNADAEGRVEIFDVGSLRVVRAFQTPGYARAIELSPNGRWLAMGREALQIWDLETGAIAFDYPHQGAVTFTAANHLLAARAAGGFVEIDLATNRELASAAGPKFTQLVAHGDRIYAVDHIRIHTFDAKGTELEVKTYPSSINDVRATAAGLVVATDAMILIGDAELHGRYFSVAVHGSLVAATTNNETVEIFEDGKRSRILDTIRHHDALAFHPRGDLLVTAGGDGARLWNARDGKHLSYFAQPATGAFSLAFDARGEQLAVGSTAGHVAIWSLSTGAVSTLTVRPGSTIEALAFGPTGDLATSAADLDAGGRTPSIITVFDSKHTRRWIRELDRISYLGYRPGTDTLTTTLTIGKDDGSTTMAAVMWKPDGTRDRTLDLVTSRGFHWTLDGGAFRGTTNTELVTAALDGTTTRMDLPHASSAQHPDGTQFAASLDDGKVAIWDLARKAPMRVVFDDNGSFSDLAWTPDGKTFVTASYDTVTLWDPSTGDRLAALVDPARILAIAVRPDGRVIAAGHVDGRVTLWSIATGTLIATLHSPGELAAFATSPDGAIDGTLPDLLSWSAGTHVLPARGAFARQRVAHLLPTRLAQLPHETAPPRARAVAPAPPAVCYPNGDSNRRALRTTTLDGNRLRLCLEWSFEVQRRPVSPPLMCFDLDLATGKYTPHAPSPLEALGQSDGSHASAELDEHVAHVCKASACRDVAIRKTGDPDAVSVFTDTRAKFLAAVYRIAESSRAAVLVYDVASGKRVSQFIAQGDALSFEFLDESLLVTSTPCAGPCSSSALFDVRKGREVGSLGVNTSTLSPAKLDGDVWAFNDWDSTQVVLQNVKTGRVAGGFKLPNRACTNEPDSDYVSCEGITMLAVGSKLVVLPSVRPGDAMVFDRKGKLLAEHALPICQ